VVPWHRLGVIRALAPSEVDEVGAVLGLARLYQGDGVYLVAWRGPEPVGHLHLALTDPPEIQDLEVRAESRGVGVASRLVAAAEAECIMRERRTLTVTVSVDNDVARALYAKLGYLDAGIEPRRIRGTVMLRTGPIEVDDTLLTLQRHLAG